MAPLHLITSWLVRGPFSVFSLSERCLWLMELWERAANLHLWWKLWLLYWYFGSQAKLIMWEAGNVVIYSQIPWWGKRRAGVLFGSWGCCGLQGLIKPAARGFAPWLLFLKATSLIHLEKDVIKLSVILVKEPFNNFTKAITMSSLIFFFFSNLHWIVAPQIVEPTHRSHKNFQQLNSWTKWHVAKRDSNNLSWCWCYLRSSLACLDE